MAAKARHCGFIRWAMLALLMFAVVSVPLQKHPVGTIGDNPVSVTSASDAAPPRNEGGCGPGSICVACALMKQLQFPSMAVFVPAGPPEQTMARVGNSSVPRSSVIRDHFRPPISAPV